MSGRVEVPASRFIPGKELKSYVTVVFEWGEAGAVTRPLFGWT
jgi:hypothetical protein